MLPHGSLASSVEGGAGCRGGAPSAAFCSSSRATAMPPIMRNPTSWESPRHARAARAQAQTQACSQGLRISPMQAACTVSSRISPIRQACSAGHRPPGPTREDVGAIIDVVPELGSSERLQMVAELAQTTNYLELKALLQKWGQVSGGDIAAYAMLQAANLRATVEMEAMAHLEVGQAADLIEAKDQVVQSLLPVVEQHISEFPPSTQCTLVSALAQLQCDSESIFSAVAHACCQAGDATGGVADILAAAASSPSTQDQVILPSRPLARHNDLREEQSPRVHDEHGVLGLQLMMVASGFALAGHYDQRLFHLLARQTVQYLDCIANPPTLINILGAFMDVQHFDRELLEQAGQRIAEDLASLEGDDAVTVLLIFAFFNVKNAGFYSGLLETVEAKLSLSELDAKTASALYRGVKLLPEPVPIPPAVSALLDAALEQYGPVQLSVMSPDIPSVEVLNKLEQSDRIDKKTLHQMRMADIIVRREIFMVLEEFGQRVPGRNQPATDDGWLLAHVSSLDSGGRKVAFQVLGSDRVCSNDGKRLRGPVQSEIQVMQRAGWIVVPVTVAAWAAIVADNMDDEGGINQGGFLTDIDSATQRAAEELRRISQSRGWVA